MSLFTYSTAHQCGVGLRATVTFATRLLQFTCKNGGFSKLFHFPMVAGYSVFQSIFFLHAINCQFDYRLVFSYVDSTFYTIYSGIDFSVWCLETR